MIAMLRREACSGALDDLAHVTAQNCLADCLTKSSAKPDNLLDAIKTGRLPCCDTHPPFRSLLEHRAYLSRWLIKNVQAGRFATAFLGVPIELVPNRAQHYNPN